MAEKRGFDLSTIIAFASLLIATGTLVTSGTLLLSQIRLNTTQQDELEYSKRMIAKADFSSPIDQVPIVPINSAFVPYDSYLTFLSLGKPARWYISNEKYDFTGIVFEIEKTYSRTTSFNVNISGYETGFPVILDSHYYFNGRAVDNRSLYEIKYHYDFSPKKNAPATCKVQLVSMNLIRNLEINEGEDRLINDEYAHYNQTIDRFFDLK